MYNSFFFVMFMYIYYLEFSMYIISARPVLEMHNCRLIGLLGCQIHVGIPDAWNHNTQHPREISFVIKLDYVQFFLFFSDETTMYKISFLIAMYSLRPKKQVTLGFKICPKKHVILPYLESACMQESISAKYG